MTTPESAPCPDTDDGKHCLMKLHDGFVCAPCAAALEASKGHHVVADLTREATR